MEKANENKMGTMPEGRLILTMSFPIMLSMLVQALYNIVDSAFVARISEDALTAVTLAFPVQLLMIAVATGTGVGINALLSRRLGEQKQQEADAVASNGIFLSVCFWILFAVLGLLFGRTFISLFTDIPTGNQLCNCCFGCLLRCIFAVHSRTSDAGNRQHRLSHDYTTDWCRAQLCA